MLHSTYHQRPALLSSFPLYQVCDDRQLPWSRVCNDPQQVKDLLTILTNQDFPPRHKKSIVGHTANNTPALTRWTLASWLEPSSLTSVHVKGRLCGSRICRSLWRPGAPGEILEQHQDFWGAWSCHQLPYQVTWFKSGGGASGGAEDHSQDARQVPQGGHFHFLCRSLLITQQNFLYFQKFKCANSDIIYVHIRKFEYKSTYSNDTFLFRNRFFHPLPLFL